MSKELKRNTQCCALRCTDRLSGNSCSSSMTSITWGLGGEGEVGASEEGERKGTGWYGGSNQDSKKGRERRVRRGQRVIHCEPTQSKLGTKFLYHVLSDFDSSSGKTMTAGKPWASISDPSDTSIKMLFPVRSPHKHEHGALLGAEPA